MMMTLKIDPKDFISPPFVTCPKCDSQRFGVLMVNCKNYIRRCQDCMYPNQHRGEHYSIPLPSLRKKVIYLDQFAISNMVMALDPESKAHREGKFAPGTAGERWLTVYEKLYRLYWLQLIVCPHSIFHVEESLVAPHMQKKFKRFYELLSHNNSFHSPQSIQDAQIYHYAEHWAKGEEADFSAMEPESVTRDPIHVWNEKFIVTVGHKWTMKDIEEQKKTREQGYKSLGAIAARWRAEQKTFQQYFAEEGASYGRAVMKTYYHYLMRKMCAIFFPAKVEDLMREKNIELVEAIHPHVQLVNGIHKGFFDAGLRNEEQEIPASMIAMFQQLGVPQEQITMANIHSIMQSAGLPDTRAMQKVGELLLSNNLYEKVPYVRIQSLLWADLAVRIRQSTHDPNRGTFNDVELISTLLPYCDAMMVDWEWCNALWSKPVRERLGYETQVFAPKCMQEFCAYLDAIEATASPEHLQQVAEVYGEIPTYTSIFGLQEVSS